MMGGVCMEGVYDECKLIEKAMLHICVDIGVDHWSLVKTGMAPI